MQRIQLVGFFFFFPFCAFAQHDFVNENPIAYQYLLKHFGLKGKVKLSTTYGSNNYLMTQESFDQEGRMTILVNFSASKPIFNIIYSYI